MSDVRSDVRTGAQLRESFLKYFEKQGHARVASSSLVPANDPTLLFTNAGMVQFKDCFLGLDQRPYTRATTAQKVVRAGGKHNDLENVGFTPRHHTFFEMLGNFSFGDYFKKDAIHYAWDYVTRELGLPKDKLRVTVFEKDDEAVDIWHKQEGVPLDRIVRFGEADNFWSMGETGPCGPCSEIFFDRGAHHPDDDSRWLEFWNLVFMQFDRSADGKLTPLKKPSIDTGLGFERTLAILQGKNSNYETDLMMSLIDGVRDLSHKRSGKRPEFHGDDFRSSSSSALRVVVDHLRSTSFLLTDGVLPSNEGRGYVLRRILRRAVRYGKTLGFQEPFLFELFDLLQSNMGVAYPELVQRASHVKEILKIEEEKFFETLHKGLEQLEHAFERQGSAKELPADLVFLLYDSYGFPLDLTALIARERGLTVNEHAVQGLMEEQRERARASWKGSGEHAVPAELKEWKGKNIVPQFVGYTKNESESRVVALSAGQGDVVWAAIDPTPFYAEGGGQSGDQGTLRLSDGAELQVENSIKPYENGFAIAVRDPGRQLKSGAMVQARVSAKHRRAVKANHSATHLLHAALRSILGTHVEQAGSYVGPDRLRFDFSHPKSVGADQLQAIEQWVNRAIEAGQDLEVKHMSYDAAIEFGAIALFGEKYGSEVRVIAAPGLSVELCGGTHASNTSELQTFKILSESAVASGVRRIEAVAGEAAMEWFHARSNILQSLCDRMKLNPDHVLDRVDRLVQQQKELEKEIEQLKRKLISGSTSESASVSITFQGKPVLVHLLDPDMDAKMIREKGDQLRRSDSVRAHVLVAGTQVLVTADSEKVGVHAGELLKALTEQFGGRGGGQAQTAQGRFERVIDQNEIQKFGHAK